MENGNETTGASNVSTLLAGLQEWQGLRAHLWAVLSSTEPLRAALLNADRAGNGPLPGRVLRQGWQACRAALDRLEDFGAAAVHTGPALQVRGSELRGASWFVDLLAARAEADAALAEGSDRPALCDLVDHVHHTSMVYLRLIERPAQDVLKALQEALSGKMSREMQDE